MLNYWQGDVKEQISVKYESKYNIFFFLSAIWSK